MYMKRSYARYRYREHRKGAKYRNIPFLLSFEEWDDWWLNQGVDRNIPKANDGESLCMCRFNDQGAYSLDNIYCATKRQNSSDAHRFNPGFSSGKSKKIHTPYGIFPSKILAANAYKVNTTTISSWLKKKSKLFYYL